MNFVRGLRSSFSGTLVIARLRYCKDVLFWSALKIWATCLGANLFQEMSRVAKFEQLLIT